MRLLGKIFYFPLLLAGILVATVLVISGWSSHLYSPSFPILSLAGMAFPAVFLANALFLLIFLLTCRRALPIPILAIILTIKPLLTYCPLNFKHVPVNADDSQLTFLSYNVHYFQCIGETCSDKDNPIIRYISECPADIICLQESNCGTVSKMIANDGKFQSELKYVYNSDCVSVLSRWPIIGQRHEKFKDSNNDYFYCRILKGDDTLAVYSCHFQSIGLKQNEIDDYNKLIAHPQDTSSIRGSKSAVSKIAAASIKRAEQADMVAELLDKETARYIILCGDFNDTPLSYSHNVIASRLTDIYRKSGFGPGISYHENRLYFRIDHAFCSSSLTPVSCRIDRSVKASDHYPVLSRLKFN